MNKNEIIKETKKMIDELKSVTTSYGLGNDGNEYKVITQIFLYKFLNDKFLYEIKGLDKKLSLSNNIETDLKKINKDEYQLLLMQLNESTAHLNPDQLISSLYNQQNEINFSKIFDKTLEDISIQNSEVFSVLTDTGTKIVLFEKISENVRKRPDDFCKAIINKLINFSFENIFQEKFDFYSTIFEYLIKDYNNNSGGTYAEYFTPHAVSKIMSSCLVSKEVKDVSCYDPSAGSGTLLMNLADKIGVDRCSIFSQDISQKSSQLLRLNLILNNLVHSVPNIIEGNTILEPFHREDGEDLKKFDYVVSNPPFKLDFSDYRNDLDSQQNKERFFAGIPNIPKKDKDEMAIYLLFIQHILFSLKEKGKSAIVVPTGFLSTANKGTAYKIRKYLIDNKFLKGVISMPSNIFAKTGTNVSIIFIDKENLNNKQILIDASSLGEKISDGDNQKTVLSENDENKIIDSFNNKKNIENFSILANSNDISEKNYSLSPSHYFDFKIKYSEISSNEFATKMDEYEKELNQLFNESNSLDKKILKNFKLFKYEKK